MMENNVKDRTQLVFIIDRSGSMSGLERDTVGGFNRVLEDNRKLPGECYVSTILFDHERKVLHNMVPLSEVPAMTLSDYEPRGSTALLDAMGEAINHVVWESDPGRVQFIIITDGEENSSRKYRLAEIRDMVTRLQEERGWDFIFLGANMDAISKAGEMGIRADRAVEALSDEEGTVAQYESISAANVNFRACSAPCMDASWKDAVEKDRKRRKH